jgi:hypothetical protein
MNIVPRDFVELTPISSVLLRLPITLLSWWIGMIIMGLVILALTFSLGVRDTLTILWLL